MVLWWYQMKGGTRMKNSDKKPLKPTDSEIQIASNQALTAQRRPPRIVYAEMGWACIFCLVEGRESGLMRMISHRSIAYLFLSLQDASAEHMTIDIGSTGIRSRYTPDATDATPCIHSTLKNKNGGDYTLRLNHDLTLEDFRT